jgi:GT2 family glycosyltransferase
MNDRPFVAIVVLNYNGKDYLLPALRSLEALKYESKKVIVVDNRSGDDSLDRAREAFPQHIFIRNAENRGFAAGMNVGIREAFRLGAEYIWLLNNDAETGADTLTALVDACEADPTIGAASPIITDFSGKEWFAGGKISYLRMRAVHIAKKPEIHPYESEYLSGCAIFFRASALSAAGLFNERYFLYYEDVDISLRIRSIGWKLCIVPRARVSHHEQSERKNPQKLYHLVYSGLVFFHENTPTGFRLWLLWYEWLRRIKNRTDLFFGRPGSKEVRRAYEQYDFQSGTR